MTVSEKVAYIRGLADGLKLDTDTNEGKLLSAIIDVLGDIASDLEDIEENALDIGDELDTLSDDLAEVEDIVYGCDCCDCDDDECDCCDCDDDCDCDDCDCDDEMMFSATCPNCGEELEIAEDIVESGECVCPSCGETLEFEFDEDDEEDEN